MFLISKRKLEYDIAKKKGKLGNHFRKWKLDFEYFFFYIFWMEHFENFSFYCNLHFDRFCDLC